MIYLCSLGEEEAMGVYRIKLDELYISLLIEALFMVSCPNCGDEERCLISFEELWVFCSLLFHVLSLSVRSGRDL